MLFRSHHTELAAALEGRALHLQLHGASVAYREIAAFCPDRAGFFFIFDDDLASINVDRSVCGGGWVTVPVSV